MQYYWRLAVLAVALMLVFPSVSVTAAPDRPLKMTVECEGNPSCDYSRKGIPVSFKITNVSQEDVFLTAAYMQKAGPYVTTRDRRSKSEWYGHHRLGTDELLSDYLALRPGEATTLIYTLYSEDVGVFGEEDKAVDITVEFAYSGYWFGPDRQLKSFEEKASIRVSTPGKPKR